MKKYLLYSPALVLLIFTAVWLRHGSAKSAALQSAIVSQRAALTPPPQTDDRAAVAAENEASVLMARNAAVNAELRRIEEATGNTLKEIAAMQKGIPPSLDTEITESFGRITDMGTEFGQYVRLIAPDFDEVHEEMKRRGIKFNELSGTMVKAFLKFASRGPEISAFEDTPVEIAALQSSALRETFGLNDTQTKQAEAIINAHFATMKASGLTYSSHDAPGWRERRSASLTQLLWNLRPLLPANSKRMPKLTQIVNVGAGVENRTVAPAPGTSEPQKSQGFANWPAVPWLPTQSSR